MINTLNFYKFLLRVVSVVALINIKIQKKWNLILAFRAYFIFNKYVFCSI